MKSENPLQGSIILEAPCLFANFVDVLEKSFDEVRDSELLPQSLLEDNPDISVALHFGGDLGERLQQREAAVLLFYSQVAQNRTAKSYDQGEGLRKSTWKGLREKVLEIDGLQRLGLG